MIGNRRLAAPLAATSLATLVILLVAGVALGGGVGSTVEGGAYFDFVAPDPLGPTDGTIRFGFNGAVETIAADAELVPPADTNLAFFGGGTPTCLEVSRDGAVITRLAFVGECNVSGTVVRVDDLFGPGADAYLIADRVAAPAGLVEGDPTFGTMIGVPAAAGTELDITFQIDLATGVPTSFTGQTSVTGAVTLLAGGNIGVGAATLPTEVIDAASREQLEDAAALGVDATVAIVGLGTIQQKGDPTIEIELTVSYAAPTPVPTAAPTTAALPNTRAEAAGPEWLGPIVLGLGLIVAGLGRAFLRRRNTGA